MGRKGKSSIVHEVVLTINLVNKIGESKHEARMVGRVEVHSIRQIKATISVAQNFVKWVRNEFHIRSVYELTETHYRAYLLYMEELGRSTGHLQNIETALRHLQEGMNRKSLQLKRDPIEFVSQRRLVDWRNLKKPEDRSYSLEEFNAISSRVSKKVYEGILLCYHMGLRVKEAACVRVKHFNLDGPGIQLEIEDGKGITKGGRFRYMTVPSYFESTIRKLIEGKDPEEQVVSVRECTIRKGVNDACRKVGIEQRGRGTHGFRHSYCRRRFKELLRMKGREVESQVMLDRIMVNRDQGRNADYGILLPADKVIYKQLKEVVDLIHSEIGHGKDRWDLAERYLR